MKARGAASCSCHGSEFAQAVPAFADFHVLTVVGDEMGFPSTFSQSPVVAWALESGSLYPHPITLEGTQTDQPYILKPSGCVYRQPDDYFPSAVEWLADQQQNFKSAKQGQ